MPCLAASCAVVSSPRSASKATFDLKSAEYRVRLPVIRVHPSRRRTELNHLPEIPGPPQSNGPTEGQIVRLKTLKRTMGGRAGCKLLRPRMLPLSPASLYGERGRTD